MKISCSKDHLADRLAIVARAASTRASIQIAGGIRIAAAAADEPIELAATDLELSLRVPLDAAIAEPGACVVPARLAQEIVRSLGAERVELSVEGNDGRLRISSGGGEYLVQTLPIDDFPRLPAIDHERVFAIDRTAFVGTVERVVRAASRDESRPVLTGVYIQIEPEELTMVATDSYRMAVKSTRITDPIPEPLDAIVPARALVELGRLVGSSPGPLSVIVAQNVVAFGVDEVWMTARRIEGQFPNYRTLLPETFEHDVRLPRAELAEVVRRVGIFARHTTPIRLRFDDGAVRVSAAAQDVGEAHESIPAPFTGEAFEIGFNADFLRDGVDVVADDDVHVRLTNPLRPALLKNDDGDFSYLIMPIRLS